MGIIDTLISFTYSLDKLLEVDLEKLNSFEDIERLDELIELLISLDENETFKKISTIDKIGEDGDAFDYDIKKIPLHYGAQIGLGFTNYIPIYLPSITKKIVDINDMISIMAMIQCSFIKDIGHILTTDDDKVIKLSDMLYMLTFYVEDYDNPDNEVIEHDFEYYKEFFHQLHYLYWEDDDANQLDKRIISYRGYIAIKNDLPNRFFKTFSRAATYLMGCNALKEGRDSISCDDVVVGYLTGFKLILNEIRPLVYKLYDEEKWADESSYK